MSCLGWSGAIGAAGPGSSEEDGWVGQMLGDVRVRAVAHAYAYAYALYLAGSPLVLPIPDRRPTMHPLL